MEKAFTSYAGECLGAWAWVAGLFLGFRLLQLCQGAEQCFEGLALSPLLFVV